MTYYDRYKYWMGKVGNPNYKPTLEDMKDYMLFLEDVTKKLYPMVKMLRSARNHNPGWFVGRDACISDSDKTALFQLLCMLGKCVVGMDEEYSNEC